MTTMTSDGASRDYHTEIKEWAAARRNADTHPST
jgi:hypothetical protein